MKTKKVLCSQVEFTGEVDICKLICDRFFNKKVIVYNDKKVEMSHITDESNFILGMFVTTQVTNIPPGHLPGNEEDYSVVDLGEGRGLAYPNVFLYDKSRHVILWEVNRTGVTEQSMQTLFNDILKKEDIYSECDVRLLPLLSSNAYKRVSDMIKIDEIEFQIVNPQEYLLRENTNNSLAGIATLVNDFDATKSIKVTIQADEDKTVNKSSLLNLVKFIQNIIWTPKGRMRNKIVIKGLKNDDDGRSIEDTINVLLDRMTSYFEIKEYKRNTDLQVTDRKQGIKEAYSKIKKDIAKLVG
ncbi:hypothetical protein FACS1894179_04920 [Bacteroidia bacterium]|nr:hypothetical protein FACS1894179_04920 [Bacteroidia bacterium]